MERYHPGDCTHRKFPACIHWLLASEAPADRIVWLFSGSVLRPVRQLNQQTDTRQVIFGFG